MASRLRLRTEGTSGADDADTPAVAGSTIRAIAHLWCWPVGGREEDAMMIVSTLPIDADFTFVAVRRAQDWYEELLGATGEQAAGIDPDQWRILDIEGIDLEDAFGKMGHIDPNGVYRPQLHTVAELTRKQRKRATLRWDDEEDRGGGFSWHDDLRDYTWGDGGGSGYTYGSWGSFRGSVEAGIRAAIGRYCATYGHDHLIRSEEDDHA